LWDVVSGLESGIDSFVGENGKCFSGGQRQRLAIARALYKQPSLLILDEATSALDVDTEQRLSETIRHLKGSLTIIVIAHRLSTLQACDRLIMMKDARIVDDGAYEELLQRNETFRHLVYASQVRGTDDRDRRETPIDAVLGCDDSPEGQ
jgi:ABC-type multidrug transport system fused ATPase/permease subunit